MFLSMSGVIGKTKSEVAASLSNYANSVGGGLQKENLPVNDDKCCIIEEANGNTTIFYPYAYLEWDSSSEFISKDLVAPVFSFHIHDGDLWMYILFVNGTLVDQFNPVPDYWDDNLSEEELESWKGEPAIINTYVKNIKTTDIEKYLVRWDLETEEIIKAYPSDEYPQEDWQLLDFMKKLGLPYPLDGNGNPKDETYKLWTKDIRSTPASNIAKPPQVINPPKAWWKFW